MARLAGLRQRETDLGCDEALELARLVEACGAAGERGPVLRRALSRLPDCAALWLAWIDAANDEGRWATVLQRCTQAEQALGPLAELHFRRGRAFLEMDQALGSVAIRRVEGGRPGRFADGWLLLEPRGPDRFLACPPASALNQVRLAIDSGLDSPCVHLLHARVWQEIGKPEVAFNLLKCQEARLLETQDPACIQALADAALAAEAVDDFLRYSCRLAELQPEARASVLTRAYLDAADHFARRGEPDVYRGFCHRALRLRGNDVELLLQVADTEWQAGEVSEAAVLYQRALSLAPQHPQRGRMLSRVADATMGEEK